MTSTLFINNAKQISNEDNTVVLRLNLELVNHSCSPNAINESGDTDAESELRATKDICKGDEVTLCYLDDFMNFGSIARKRKTRLEKIAHKAKPSSIRLEERGRYPRQDC